MKKIEAFVKPFRLEEVRDALLRAGVEVMSVAEVQDLGKLKQQEFYRGNEYEVDSFPRSLIICLVEDDKEEDIINVIRAAARTGNVGDGKIIVTRVDRIVPVDADEVSNGISY